MTDFANLGYIYACLNNNELGIQVQLHFHNSVLVGAMARVQMALESKNRGHSKFSTIHDIFWSYIVTQASIIGVKQATVAIEDESFGNVSENASSKNGDYRN